MHKKILSSVLLITLVAGLVGSGTYAYFTDSAQSTANTMTAGIVDLVVTNTALSPNHQWYFKQGTVAVPGTPGKSKTVGDIRIHNCGNIPADHVELNFKVNGLEDKDGIYENGVTQGSSPEPKSDKVFGTSFNGVDMSSFMEIDTLVYQVTDGYYFEIVSEGDAVVTTPGMAGYLYDKNENGWIDLDDLASIDLDNLPAPPNCNNGVPDYINYATLYMMIKFVDDGTDQNYFQGDIVDMTVEVTLNQDASQ